MSSILKALKKLENETSPYNGAATPPAFNIRQALRRQMKPAMRKRPWVSSMLVLILFAGGVLFFKGDQTEIRPPIVPVVPAVEKAKALPTPVPLTITTSTIAAPSLPQLLKKPTDLPPRVTEKTTPITALNRKATEKPPLIPARDKAIEIHAPAPEMKRMPLPQKEARTSPAASPADLMALPAEVGLKLQALAWASEPASRFAVINSQIAREGESVGDMNVERIEQERVILRKGGELYQLKY
ncbi:MAG: general secretion pathway protein GspB [Desulfobacterales bacterium]|jgi:hypothetical protein|nr:general secretion pathway protein GspB [Desulfobacterales bacterium]